MTSRQIVTLTRMSLSSSTLFHSPGRPWAKVRLNSLLADCTLRKSQHQKDCGNIEAFTRELTHSSRHLFIFVCVVLQGFLSEKRRCWLEMGNLDALCSLVGTSRKAVSTDLIQYTRIECADSLIWQFLSHFKVTLGTKSLLLKFKHSTYISTES